jgi:tRNA dimethylallyltransferase
MKKPLIILTGPTAAGKTDISIKLAKKIGGEIISADSMQVYRRMDIGTAKITEAEMHGIRHHLIDVLEPTESFNVSVFKDLANKAAEDIYSRGKIPIMVGGTGFYIQALLYDIDFSEELSDGYRESLEAVAQTEGGVDKLFHQLMAVDPASCEIIHKNNVKKVIRALEFYHYNGTPISEHNSVQREKQSAYDSMYLVLTMDRAKLYSRIEKRVDIMMDNGLIEEVRRLMDEGLDDSYISMQGIGYKEVYEYLKGNCTEEEAVYKIKQNTRHFAKRQLTWFKREKDVIWIDKDNYASDEEIADHIVDLWRNKHVAE